MQNPSKLIEIEQPPVIERAILARLRLPGDRDWEIEESLDELAPPPRAPRRA